MNKESIFTNARVVTASAARHGHHRGLRLLRQSVRSQRLQAHRRASSANRRSREQPRRWIPCAGSWAAKVPSAGRVHADRCPAAPARPAFGLQLSCFRHQNRCFEYGYSGLSHRGMHDKPNQPSEFTFKPKQQAGIAIRVESPIAAPIAWRSARCITSRPQNAATSMNRVESGRWEIRHHHVHGTEAVARGDEQGSLP